MFNKSICAKCFKTFPLTQKYFEYYPGKFEGYYNTVCNNCRNITAEKPKEDPSENILLKTMPEVLFPIVRTPIKPKKIKDSKHFPIMPIPQTDLESIFLKIRKRLISRSKKKFPNSPIISWYDLIELHKKQQGKCFYTKLPYNLVFTRENPKSMSIDRIDSSIGYTLENTVLCCWFVNCAKSLWDLNQIKALWKYLPTI